MSKAKSSVKTMPVEHDYDTPEGVRAAVQAAKAGDGEAAETLARRLTWILSGDAPYSEAELDELIEVAEAGWSSILNDKNCHPDDMFQYAVDILWDDEGSLIPENAADASAWMLRAAELGHPDAQLEVGRFYYEGVGLKQSEDLAVEWFTKAAQNEENAEHAEFFLAEIKKNAGKAAKATKSSKKKAPAAKKAPVKKEAAAKKAPAKAKAPAKKTAAKAAPAKAAKKAPVAKKTVVKKAAPVAKKPTAKAKAPAKKVVAKKTVAKAAPAKVAKKAPAAKKAAVKKAAAPAAKKTVAKAPAKKAPVKAAAKPVKKAPAKKVAAKRK